MLSRYGEAYHGGRIYEPEPNQFVVSHCSTWLPGCYASLEAAKAAIDLGLGDETLDALGRNGQLITLEQLREASKK